MRVTPIFTWLTAALVCCGGPQQRRGTREQAEPALAVVEPKNGALLPQDSSTSSGQSTGAEGPTAAYAGRSVETACNGKDDDGDGLIDVLMPAEPNACHTGRKGACDRGWSICEAGQKTCSAPPPTPEVKDGVDNDCNGIVDDVPLAKLSPRAVLLTPKYVWSDAAPDVANVTSALVQAGIPYDKAAAGSDWTKSFDSLDEHTLAIIPGYMMGSTIAGVLPKLTSFVERGGVVVIFKPVGKKENPAALTFCGLRDGARRRDVTEIRFDAARGVATSLFDSAEERALRINAKGAKDGIEVWAFDVDPSSNAETLASAFVDSERVGSAITRRPMGKGAVYALGHDLTNFGAPRCYGNCFESSADSLRLFFEGVFREATMGHVVTTHPAPEGADTVLMVTHDANTAESLNPGAWGDAGVIQLAKVSRSRNVRATFNILADIRGGQFNSKTVKALCALGMCPLGIQGVSRVGSFSRMPDGVVRAGETREWKCRESLDTYGPNPSLCGEVLLSRQLVQSASGKSPRVWRSPHLAVHNELYDTLFGAGISFDSSLGIGDLPFALPVDLATTGVQQHRFHHRPLLEFPLALDDGIDTTVDGKSIRIELQPANEMRFRNLWEYVVLQNANNRAFTTLRIHASRGDGTPSDNVAAKAAILDRFLEQMIRPDRVVRSIDEVGDFWRARVESKVAAQFDRDVGYSGTFTMGKTTTKGITLEFGDTIESFDCPQCGETKVVGKRVVFVGSPTVNSTATFVAKLRK